ncbi:MAG: EAL domain-containing protein [Rhodocyclales bacterium GT-UBC]|nr:MAG: EAL domain-containing protein [Rhodocyclales bacterium GT-UBC]
MLKRGHLWIMAVRDSFVSLIPVTLFGVIAILLQDFPLPAYQSMMGELFSAQWKAPLRLIQNGTHGVFGMMLCVLIAIHVVHRLKNDFGEEIPHILVGSSALTNFMIFIAVQGPLNAQSLNHEAISVGIGVGILSAEILRWAAGTRLLNLTAMPYDTERIFYHSLRLTTPVICTGLCITLVAFAFKALPAPPLDFWRNLVDTVQRHGSAAWWLSSLATLINQLFWFIGAHGSHFLDSYATALFAPWGTPYDGTLASRTMFNAFVLLGGSGATLGLLLAIRIVVHAGPSRKLMQFSVLPGLFNINETILYGLPVVLNPTYLFPFIVVPLLLTGLTLGCFDLGLLELRPDPIPWTTPPLISGWLLTGSWRGVAWQIAELALSTALYLPFVKQVESRRLRRQSHNLAETTEAILSEGRIRVPIVSRHDQVGLIARGLLTDLRHDLQRDVFQLAYQPKHALNGGVVGVEALLRWPHRRHGALSPAIAVTLAEDSGDIHQLGRWVLEQACACKARWNSHGFGQINMAVNVSPLQLTDRQFVPRLAEILKRHGLAPDEIELEITESQHIPDSSVVDTALRDLSALGIRLSMDDFGMGYSSLLHLRRFHVHAIKIDGTLTRDVLSNTTSADIIRTIATLGRAQKIDVIAEFVETRAQRERLAELGCDCFQGYFHSPALYEKACLEYFRLHAAGSAANAD